MAETAELPLDIKEAQQFINLMAAIAKIDNQQARVYSVDLFPDDLQPVPVTGEWDAATHEQALKITQFLHGKTSEELKRMVEENNGSHVSDFKKWLWLDPEDRQEKLGNVYRLFTDDDNRISEENIKRFIETQEKFVALTTMAAKDVAQQNQEIITLFKSSINELTKGSETGALILNDNPNDPNMGLKIVQATKSLQDKLKARPDLVEVTGLNPDDIKVTGVWDDTTWNAVQAYGEHFGENIPDDLKDIIIFGGVRQSITPEQLAAWEKQTIEKMQGYINLVAEIRDIDEWQIGKDLDFPAKLKPVDVTGEWDEATQKQAKILSEFLANNDDNALKEFIDEINHGAKGVERWMGPLAGTSFLEGFKDIFGNGNSRVTTSGRQRLLALNDSFVAFAAMQETIKSGEVKPTPPVVDKPIVTTPTIEDEDDTPDKKKDEKVKQTPEKIAALEAQIKDVLIKNPNQVEGEKHYRGERVEFQGTAETFKIGDDSEKGLSHNRATWTILNRILHDKNDELVTHDQEFSKRHDQWLDNKDQWQKRLSEAQKQQEAIATKLGNKDDILKELQKKKDPKEFKSSDIAGKKPNLSADDVSSLLVQLTNLETERRNLEKLLIEPTFDSIFGYDRSDAQASINHIKSLRDTLGGIIGHGPAPDLSEKPTPDDEGETYNLKVYDRFFKPEVYQEIAQNARTMNAEEYSAYRREIGKDAMNRLIEQAAEQGIERSQITAALMGRLRNADGNIVFFSPHMDDLRLAHEGMPMPAGYDFPLIEDGRTASLRNQAWDSLFGGLSEEEHFRLVRRFRSEIPDDMTLEQAKADAKLWPFVQEEIAISQKYSDSAFAMIRVSSANPDSNSDFNKEYEYRRAAYLNQQAAERAAEINADANNLSRAMNAAASGQAAKPKDETPGGSAAAPAPGE